MHLYEQCVQPAGERGRRDLMLRVPSADTDQKEEQTEYDIGTISKSKMNVGEWFDLEIFKKTRAVFGLL